MPAVKELLNDKDAVVRAVAAYAVGKLGEPKTAVAALTPMLQNSRPEARAAAAQCLGGLGPDAIPAVPSLVELLKDKDWRIRRSAAETLGKLGPVAIPALTDVLSDENH